MLNDKQRKLIRLFYQSIPTQAEKDTFYKVMNSDKEDRIKFLGELVGKNVNLDKDIVAAIMASSVLTKEDRVMIFSGIVRQWIFTILSKIGF